MRKHLVLLAILVLQLSAGAATFTVTNCASGTEEGSFLRAVMLANEQTPGASIEFDIPDTDPGYTAEAGVSFWRVPIREQAVISRNLVSILGGTQKLNRGDTNPGGPSIEIVPSSEAGALDSLIKILAVNECTIEGLAVNGSPGHGITVSGGNRNHVRGNFTGAHPSGTRASPNAQSGIYLLACDHNEIGGAATFEGNLISGNLSHGVLSEFSTYNEIRNNRIGAGTSEGEMLGNAGAGLLLRNESHDQLIEMNVIASNEGGGVVMDGAATRYNALYMNRMFSNAGAGIRLLSGANGSADPPSILSAEVYTLSDSTYVAGRSSGRARIEIFRVETPEADDAGEGAVFLASTEANLAGEWFTYIGQSLAGQKITATQTDTGKNTSQFALNKGPISIATEHRPDAEIGTVADGSDYVGKGIFSSSGAGQTKAVSLLAGHTAVYYIKASNSGTTDEALTLYGTPPDASFEVSYYDAKTGGSDITALMNAGGYATAVLPTGEGVEIRIEVKGNVSEEKIKDVYVTAASATDPTKRDVVLATTTATMPPQALTHFTFIVPASAEVGLPYRVVAEARDASGQITTEVNTRTLISVDYGSVSPEALEASAFIGSGVWVGEMTLSRAGSRRITFKSGTASGNYNMITYNTTREFSDPSLGVTVIVPPGAVSGEVSITIAEVLSLPGPLPAGKWQAGKIIDISSPQRAFAVPIEITIPLYSGARSPAVYFWSGSAWSREGLTQAGQTDSSITFLTSHLTPFAPFGDGGAAAHSFGPSPYDPARDGSAVFRYWLNSEADTTLYLFDITGRSILRRDFPAGTNGGRGGENAVEWDGRDVGGNIPANGTYLYRIAQQSRQLAAGKIILLRR